MAIYHGRHGLVYVDTTATPGAVGTLLSHMTNWTLDRATDKVEVTAFGDANKVYVQGLPDLKGSMAGYWDETDETLYTAAAATKAVYLYLYPSSDAAAKYWYGPAWMDCSIECAVDGAVKISANFVAGGSWSKK